jgi:uncharacterized protein
MTDTFASLSDDEFHELDMFLLNEVDSDEVMTIDILDGYLHAIAIAPVTLHPKQWLPQVWGMGTFMPPMESIDQLNHVLGLVMRHFNGIIAGLQREPQELSPVWATMTYRGKDYDEAEGWAYGFVEGMKLCWKDWQPILETPEGKSWFRPIALLGEESYSSDQDELTKTPARRSKIAQQIPEAVLAMHAYWLPLRQAIYQREMAKAMQPKVGRNDLCPCGSGKKFKKCCGAASNLH